MHYVVNTEALLSEGVIDTHQADEISRRSRETMVALVVSLVLCGGIFAATGGLVFWLADAAAVAIAGAIFLLVGSGILLRGGALYRMLGNASALIGSGMLIVGASIEMIDKYQPIAAEILLIAGAVIAGAAGWLFAKGPQALRFVTGATALLGAGMHLTGLYQPDFAPDGAWMAAVHLYSALLIGAAGVALNVRAVTALAIVPFAQMLDTGTFYFHAAYVFYSPEPTLTILQMAALIGVMIPFMRNAPERFARHANLAAIVAAVVGNLAFLVGSLWGDNVGATLSLNEPLRGDFQDWSAYRAAKDAWDASFFRISEHAFSIAWAVALIGGAFWAAVRARRGLLNTAVTFMAIHGYTQLFETFEGEPLAWAIGGLAAIPLAWGMWRLNLWLVAKER